MIVEKQTKCANFLKIISILKVLREHRKISDAEYSRAKAYYQKLTGADIIIVD